MATTKKTSRRKKLSAAMKKRWKSPAFRAKMKKVARKSAKSRKRKAGGRFKNPVFAFRTKKVWRVKKAKSLRGGKKSFKRARGWYGVKARSVFALPGRPKKGLKRWARWKKGGRNAAYRNPAHGGATRLHRLEKRVNLLARAQAAILRTLRGELHQLPGGHAKYDPMRGLKAYRAQRAREAAVLDRAAALELGARLNPRRKGKKRHGRKSSHGAKRRKRDRFGRFLNP
jgi:hypothetical protein